MSRALTALAIIVLAAGVRIAFGVGAVSSPKATPIRVPLSEYPREALGAGWTGVDVPVPQAVLKVARVADHLQRYYTDGRRGFWLYVGYVDHFDPAAIHHPGVCFPAIGLQQIEEGTVDLPCPASPTRLTFREARWSRTLGREVYSLSAFYFRGGFAPSEWELLRSRVLGIPYFAIVTLSAEVDGDLEGTQVLCREALCRAVPALLRHLPE